MTSCTVRSHHGAPTLFVDGEPAFAALYMAKRMPWSPGGAFQLDPDFEAISPPAWLGLEAREKAIGDRTT